MNTCVCLFYLFRLTPDIQGIINNNGFGGAVGMRSRGQVSEKHFHV